MKKLSQYLLSIMLSLFIIPFGNVHAESLDVQTINASITDNKISVDGIVACDATVLEAKPVIINEDEDGVSEPVYVSVLPNLRFSRIFLLDFQFVLTF